MKNTLWKHNVNFIKDVPMIYVNFIFTEIIVPDKKELEALLVEVLLLKVWGLQYRVHFVFAQTIYCTVSK